MIKKRFTLSSAQMIAVGFLLIILLGTALLMLPISSKSHESTPFVDSLFTATSATCVTGLVVYDTYSHWSLFGQWVILIMIQIGGLGFMTVFSLIFSAFKKPLRLRERRNLMQAAGSLSIGEIGTLLKRIFVGTALFEILGAGLLAIRFIPDFGLWEGIRASVFHSISAFCNAGFDILGSFGQFSSLEHYANDVLVNLVIMMLIVVGGIGFIVWSDIVNHKLKFSAYRLHTKIVLTTTAILILGGAVSFFFLEYNAAFEGMPTGEKIMASFFSSITMRTAGFSTVSMAELSQSGQVLSYFLMFVGGSPGSTAGGIKTVTIAVLFCTILSTIRHKKSVTVYKRRLDDEMPKQASSIALIYLSAVIVATVIICAVQDFKLGDVFFETISAAGTVGLSTGITPALNTVSRVIITLLMFGGRLGGLTIALALAERYDSAPVDRPVEKIIIG